MNTDDQDKDEQQDNIPNGTTSKPRFTYSTELYDNLGNGEPTSRRQRSYDFESPVPNYSNNGSPDMNSPYDYSHNGYNEPSTNGYDSSRGDLRAGNQQPQSLSLPTIRNKHRKIPSERLYQPRYLIERSEKREALKQSEQIDYDTSFHANLPKNLQHVKSKFRNPELLKKKQTPAQEQPLPNALFKARIPKDLDYVTSRYQDPQYMKSPRGHAEPDNSVDATFRARPPRQLEHIQSRILDPQYQHKQPPPDYQEHYDRTFKARLPKKLEHVQSKLLDPVNRDKSRAAENTDEQQYYKPEFKARPPKNLEHVEKRIYDQKYFLPKQSPRSPSEEEDVFSHEFKSRPPKALASIESRIMDPRYYRKKSPVSPIRPEDEYKPTFKARPPRDLEYIQSRVYDPKYFQKSERSSPIQSPKPERKGPVAIIKVKPEKKFELRPPGNSYAERLAMKKARDDEDYYKIWHNQFQNEVKRKIRGDPETPKTVVAVVEEDKRVKRFGRKNKQVVKEPEPEQERPIKSEGHDGGQKPRMPWLKKKKKPPPIDKQFFDKWINIPEDVLKLKGGGTDDYRSSNRHHNKNAPQVWTNDFNRQYIDSPRRQEYVGHYGGY